MNEFCKIIDVKGGGQVLVIMTYDDEGEDGSQYLVERITEFNGARMTAKGGYPTERLQQADFETFGESEAQKFFNSAKKVFNVVRGKIRIINE